MQSAQEMTMHRPRSKNRRIVGLLTTLLLATSASATINQPGTLDPFWGTGSALGPGKVIATLPTANNSANAMVLQPDGKVILAGGCNNSFCAARHLSDGTLDASFGALGSVVTPVGGASDAANAVVLQSDGKIILAGTCSNGAVTNFCALRYQPNGTLDTSFNSIGTLGTSLTGSYDKANAAVLQPDGKLVLAGTCGVEPTRDFCAARYLPNGTLDAAFGISGKLILPVGGGDDDAKTVALTPDGKLVLAGRCKAGAIFQFCAVRLNSGTGTLDSTFNGTGTLGTFVGDSSVIVTSAIVQPDLKLVLIGACQSNSVGNFCAVRYDRFGALDQGFGIGGKVITPVGVESSPFASALQPDGKLLLAGGCNDGTRSIFCALRYHSNASLDTSFNNIGTLGTAVAAQSDEAVAVAVQPDGKFILAGSCYAGGHSKFCTARYDGGPFGYKNCSLDIDGDGRLLATTDSLIHARIALGITGPAVVTDITFPPNATRNTWPLIRDYLVTQCGMSLVQ